MTASNPPQTIGYLRVSRNTQDLDKNRADILTLAHREDRHPGRCGQGTLAVG